MSLTWFFQRLRGLRWLIHPSLTDTQRHRAVQSYCRSATVVHTCHKLHTHIGMRTHPQSDSCKRVNIHTVVAQGHNKWSIISALGVSRPYRPLWVVCVCSYTLAIGASPNHSQPEFNLSASLALLSVSCPFNLSLAFFQSFFHSLSLCPSFPRWKLFSLRSYPSFCFLFQSVLCPDQLPVTSPRPSSHCSAHNTAFLMVKCEGVTRVHGCLLCGWIHLNYNSAKV